MGWTVQKKLKYVSFVYNIQPFHDNTEQGG